MLDRHNDRHNMTLQNLSSINNSFLDADASYRRRFNSSFDIGRRKRSIDLNLSLPHDVNRPGLCLKDLQHKEFPLVSEVDDLEYSQSILTDKNHLFHNVHSNVSDIKAKKLSLQLDLSKLHNNKSDLNTNISRDDNRIKFENS